MIMSTLLNLVDRLLISYDALFRDVNILMNCTHVRNLLPTQVPVLLSKFTCVTTVYMLSIKIRIIATVI